MKLSIERTVLLSAMSQAQSVVERRNTIPILANVLIEANDGKVTIRATDLDIEVVEKLDAVIEEPGATTVGAHTFHEITRKLPDGALVILEYDEEKSRLDITAGRSKFSLATLPRDDFPIMASSEYESRFSVPAPDLRRLFDKARFAMSTEEARYYLNGVFFHVVEESPIGAALRAVATDGHRLARIDVPLPNGAADIPSVIIPRKTVGELRKLLEDDDAKITVLISETKIRFETPYVMLTSKVVDGSFPDYTRVIPEDNSKRLEVDAADFARAVDRVSTISNDRSRAVKMTIDADRLVLSVNSPESGAAQEELAVAYDDEKLEIGFNAKYLHEIASQIDRENAIFLFGDTGEQTVMREGDDESTVYVVMPMRV